MRVLLFCIWILSAGISPWVRASDSLSLTQALRETEESSPTIQKSTAAADEGYWKQKEQLDGFLPKVSVTGTHFGSVRYQLMDMNMGAGPLSIPAVFPKTTLALDLSVPIFDGFQNLNRYSAGSYLRSAAEKDRDWTKFRTEQEVALKFYQAIAAERLAAVAEQNVKTLEDHHRQVLALLKGGVATHYDVLRVEVQLNEAESEQLQAQDNVVLARKRLAEVMGKVEDARELQGELPVPQEKLVADRKFPGVDGRADLQAIVDRTEAGDRQASAAWKFWVPRVNFVGEYLWYNNRDFTFTSDQFRRAYQFGVAVSWNLFDGGASFARAQEASYRRIQEEKNLEQVRLQAPVDFEFWKRRYLYSAKLHAAKLSDVEKAQESVRLAQEGFKAGIRTSTEVLDSELELFKARAGVVNAQVNAEEALLRLEAAEGRKITSW